MYFQIQKIPLGGINYWGEWEEMLILFSTCNITFFKRKIYFFSNTIITPRGQVNCWGERGRGEEVFDNKIFFIKSVLNTIKLPCKGY